MNQSKRKRAPFPTSNYLELLYLGSSNKQIRKVGDNELECCEKRSSLNKTNFIHQIFDSLVKNNAIQTKFRRSKHGPIAYFGIGSRFQQFIQKPTKIFVQSSSSHSPSTPSSQLQPLPIEDQSSKRKKKKDQQSTTKPLSQNQNSHSRQKSSTETSKKSRNHLKKRSNKDSSSSLLPQSTDVRLPSNIQSPNSLNDLAPVHSQNSNIDPNLMFSVLTANVYINELISHILPIIRSHLTNDKS